MICYACNTEMDESVTEPGIYVCQWCGSVVDTFDDTDMYVDYTYMDSLFDEIKEEDCILWRE